MRVDCCLHPQQFTLDLVKTCIPALRELLHQHQVQGAYVFGSVLDNSTTPFSDLDLAIASPENLPNWFDYYHNLYADICQLFGADNIDVVLLDRAPLSLQVRAISEGLPILLIPEELERQERVLAQYADLASWRQENWEVTRRLVSRGITKSINMIDRNRIERFIFLIRDAIQELKALKLASLGLEVYLANKQRKVLSEHYLRIALEATLDLGRHVIVRTGLGSPQEYRDIGKIMREKGILSPQLGRNLENMAGMRNVLVHIYWDIDYPLIYKTIVEHPDSFERVLAEIFMYLERWEEVET